MKVLFPFSNKPNRISFIILVLLFIWNTLTFVYAEDPLESEGDVNLSSEKHILLFLGGTGGYYSQFDYAGSKVWNAFYQGMQVDYTWRNPTKKGQMGVDISGGYWGSNRWQKDKTSLAHRERAFYTIPCNTSVYSIRPLSKKPRFSLGLGAALHLEFRSTGLAIAPYITDYQKEFHWAGGFRYHFLLQIPTIQLNMELIHAIHPMFLGGTWKFKSQSKDDRAAFHTFGIFSILKWVIKKEISHSVVLAAEYQFDTYIFIRRGTVLFSVTGELELWHHFVIKVGYRF
jgi:uncharacterized protein YhhL (DUF1145 family)